MVALREPTALSISQASLFIYLFSTYPVFIYLLLLCREKNIDFCLSFYRTFFNRITWITEPAGAPVTRTSPFNFSKRLYSQLDSCHFYLDTYNLTLNICSGHRNNITCPRVCYSVGESWEGIHRIPGSWVICLNVWRAARWRCTCNQTFVLLLAGTIHMHISFPTIFSILFFSGQKEGEKWLDSWLTQTNLVPRPSRLCFCCFKHSFVFEINAHVDENVYGKPTSQKPNTLLVAIRCNCSYYYWFV